MKTLTRAEALDRIDDAEGDSDALRAIAREWSLAGWWVDTADWGADELRQHVDDCCDADAARSRGPRDSDDTGLPDIDQGTQC